MEESAIAGRGYPILSDPWERKGPIPLDRILERQQFSPMLTALLALFFAFVFFQLIISPAAIVVMLLAKGVPLTELSEALGEGISGYTDVLLIANTIGQVLGLAIPALLFSRLHSSRWASFLRFRRVDWELVVLSVVGLVALIPLVQWLAAVNELVPLPDWLREFEQSQTELIERMLKQDGGSILFNLIVLALTPAICEELLFRGYVQRQSERSLGIVGGILFSGIVFGLYHLRLTQVVPLSVLGIYLAYVMWRTGSVWPAVVAHFTNNAFSVFLAAYTSRLPEAEAEVLDQLDLPWYFIVTGVVLFVAIIIGMNRIAREHLAARSDSGSKERGALEINEQYYGRQDL